ncbi:MAG TPA: 30S ribosomal protein S2 [Chitinophagales bacterium]|nr:30S ribosomal protein S2 [Chitinophagales bacterium]HMX04034.1 30S ribosomal protein S2 [Chitinophagales bacterium]HMZ87904.1 30S ribosomal protein S2 [Chitinophagales bacterium]HNA57947.1 30S ribosomal protein S2 [Chitinophagales bacterium]HNE47246.1 30S ribosomal protein S2 [Chitinophagales bacterium]
MEKITYNDLLEAGVHFGHLRKKWNPKMLPYIFMEKKGIHIIDLNKTLEKLDEAAAALKTIARSGKKIMFVATKKQAKEIMEEQARRVGMPFATERWLGGMLTNFTTIRKSIKKLQAIDKMLVDGSAENMTKKERLVLGRERDKLEKVIGGVAQLNRLPAALLIVDIGHEHIAIAEAHRLNITTFGMVDTNCDPNKVDFAVPANDDAAKSIAIIVKYLTDAIVEGLEERAKSKEEMDEAAREPEFDENGEEIKVNINEEEGRDGRKEGGNRFGKGPRGGGGNKPGGNRRPMAQRKK